MNQYRCEGCQTWIDWDNSIDPDEPVYIQNDEQFAYCDDCAVDRGFCPDCKRYIGVENAGLRHSGLCAECIGKLEGWDRGEF